MKQCKVRLIDILAEKRNGKVNKQNNHSIKHKQNLKQNLPATNLLSSSKETKSKMYKENKSKTKQDKMCEVLKKKLSTAENAQQLRSLKQLNSFPTTPVLTNKTKKDSNAAQKSFKNKKNKKKKFWESKLTGAKRVSKRLSNIKIKNKILEKICINGQSKQLINKESNVKSLKKNISRNNKIKNVKLTEKIKNPKQDINKYKTPIKHKGFKKLHPKTNTNFEEQTICTIVSGFNRQSFTCSNQKSAKVFGSNSGSWLVNKIEENDQIKMGMEIVLESDQAYGEKANTNPEQVQESPFDNNIDNINNERNECVISDYETDLNGEHIKIEEVFDQCIIDNSSSDFIIVDLEANEGEISGTSKELIANAGETLQSLTVEEDKGSNVVETESKTEILNDKKELSIPTAIKKHDTQENKTKESLMANDKSEVLDQTVVKDDSVKIGTETNESQLDVNQNP